MQFEYMNLSLFGRFAIEPINGVMPCFEQLEIGAESENKFMTRIIVLSPTNLYTVLLSSNFAMTMILL